MALPPPIEEQALGLESLRLVEQRGFQQLAGDFLGGDQVGGGGDDGLVAGLDLWIVLAFVAILAAGGGI